MEVLSGFGTLFYLVDPIELTATRIEDAPNFTAKAIPYVFVLGIIEAGDVLYLSGLSFMV